MIKGLKETVDARMDELGWDKLTSNVVERAEQIARELLDEVNLDDEAEQEWWKVHYPVIEDSVYDYLKTHNKICWVCGSKSLCGTGLVDGKPRKLCSKHIEDYEDAYEPAPTVQEHGSDSGLSYR